MNTNEQIVERALDRITAGHVFPDEAERVDAAIRRRLAAGEYTDLDGPALCRTVTGHLQEVCPDKHLRLLWTDPDRHLRPAHRRHPPDWTTAYLPAPRCTDRPVYVLTSSATFSGGEDVAYTLQAHGRAVVIGETTRGGAHPTVRHAVTAHVQVTVPSARTVNTVTGTNWEGVGVLPDVPVPADRALDTALDTALDPARGKALGTALAADRR